LIRCRSQAGLLLVLTVLWAAAASGQETGGTSGGPLLSPVSDDPSGIAPPPLQDALPLVRTTSGVLPADGLYSIGLGMRTYTTVYLISGQLERISQRDVFLLGDAAVLPWLHLGFEMPWHSWSDGKGFVPETGSGFKDGRWQATAGRPFLGRSLHAALAFGGNLPLGSESRGLTEGIFSPEATLAVTWRLWENAMVPEARFHFNYTRIWNQAEDTGYGGPGVYQPWPGRYPSAGDAGGHRGNNQERLGAAVEFRKQATSLWLEYARDRFLDNPHVSDGEQLSTVGAGLRWGLVEGWALHGKYLVSIAEDDPPTDWYPAFPEWTMSLAVTRQFGLGGRDTDGDGIPDRKDHCVTLAEDLDGFQDDDGCPEADNDGDGIPDFLDGDPDAPEDFDGYQDEDGIPDYDNDGDGISDLRDLCPDEPEDYDGHYDKDGCPDDFVDSDGDGVEDRNDACPDDPEDLDGFEDADGCPDPDNDLDGIPDGDDACPDEPETYNGVDDQDGCPD